MPWWGTVSLVVGGWAVAVLINILVVRAQHKKSGEDLVRSTRESLKVLETKFDLGVVTWPKHDKSIQHLHDRISDVEKDTAIDLNQLTDATQGIRVQVTEISGKLDAFTTVCNLHQKQTEKLEKKHESDIDRIDQKIHNSRRA